jgi:hypothetical protein
MKFSMTTIYVIKFNHIKRFTHKIKLNEKIDNNRSLYIILSKEWKIYHKSEKKWNFYKLFIIHNPPECRVLSIPRLHLPTQQFLLLLYIYINIFFINLTFLSIHTVCNQVYAVNKNKNHLSIEIFADDVRMVGHKMKNYIFIQVLNRLCTRFKFFSCFFEIKDFHFKSLYVHAGELCRYSVVIT